MDEFRLYWGETHDNAQAIRGLGSTAEMIGRAREHLDFYTAAYYRPAASAFKPAPHLSESSTGTAPLCLEGWKPADQLEREWADVQEATRSLNAPGEFVTFPGYE